MSLEGVDPEIGMKLIAIRKQLEVLGSSEKEQLQVLHQVQHGNIKITKASTSEEIKQYLLNLSNKSKSTIPIIELALEKNTVPLDEDDTNNLESLIAILKAVDPMFHHWITNIENNVKLPTMAIKKVLSTLSDNLANIIGTGDSVNLTTISNLSHNPELLRNLLELQSTQWTNVPIWNEISKTNFLGNNFQVDKLTELLLSQQDTNQKTRGTGFALNHSPLSEQYY